MNAKELFTSALKTAEDEKVGRFKQAAEAITQIQGHIAESWDSVKSHVSKMREEEFEHVTVTKQGEWRPGDAYHFGSRGTEYVCCPCVVLAEERNVRLCMMVMTSLPDEYERVGLFEYLKARENGFPRHDGYYYVGRCLSSKLAEKIIALNTPDALARAIIG